MLLLLGGLLMTDVSMASEVDPIAAIEAMMKTQEELRKLAPGTKQVEACPECTWQDRGETAPTKNMCSSPAPKPASK